MTRTTSAKAYREETENGNITKKQYEVWGWLKLHGPSTAREISKSIPGAWKRLAELKAKGYATDTGRLIDGLTGKTVIVWEYSLPHELWANVKVCKMPRKQLEDKLKTTEMALERAQEALKALPGSLHRVYDLAYQQGRIDERNGVKEPFYG
jgi:hypothetical protein